MKRFYVMVNPTNDAPWAGMYWKKEGGFAEPREEASTYGKRELKEIFEQSPTMLTKPLVFLIPVMD